jgi:hypothetical protein
MASRTRQVNEAMHTSMTPQQIAALFADEDIDLLIAWIEHAE